MKKKGKKTQSQKIKKEESKSYSRGVRVKKKEKQSFPTYYRANYFISQTLFNKLHEHCTSSC